MPFTPAHAAAALPFSRTRLIFSALVMGTFAPDFEYFLRLTPRGKFGHTLPGIFLFSWPAALVALWIFHRWVKWPAVMMLPAVLRERLMPHLRPFAFGPGKRFRAIAGAAFVGIATHIVWDSFTHPASIVVQHWALLRTQWTVPVLGTIPLCRVVQHTSTMAGMCALLVWFVLWYRRTPRVPLAEPPGTRNARMVLWVVLPVVALAVAALRVWAGIVFEEHDSFNRVLGNAVVASTALIWWQLAAVGYFADSSGELKRLLRGFNAALTPAPDTDE